jgi:hypothetical protein
MAKNEKHINGTTSMFIWIVMPTPFVVVLS